MCEVGCEGVVMGEGKRSMRENRGEREGWEGEELRSEFAWREAREQ